MVALLRIAKFFNMMLQDRTSPYRADVTIRASDDLGETFCSKWAVQNEADLRQRQLRQSRATSRPTVVHVVGLGAEIEMGNLDAGPHIAFMQHLHSVRDGAVRHFPSETVGINVLSLHEEMPVTSLKDSSCPEKAAVGLSFRFRPEPFLRWKINPLLGYCHTPQCTDIGIMGQYA